MTTTESNGNPRGPACDNALDTVLKDINERFHTVLAEHVARARRTIDAGDVPVLLRIENDLTLIDGPKHHRFRINGSRYHRLKALAHLPLLSFLAGRLDDERLDDVEFLERQLDDESAMLEDEGIDIAELRVAIRRAHEAGARRATRFETDDSVTALQNRLIRLAAHDEVARLLAAIDEIRSMLATPDRLEASYTVVCGGNQARYKNLSLKFFERWYCRDRSLGASAAHRVIYSEACDAADEALELVAERIVDGELAQVFLHSPVSLDEDVLGRAGESAMDSLMV